MMAKNLVALAAVVVIPAALYLGWTKHTALAWLLLGGYLGILGYFNWKARR